MKKTLIQFRRNLPAIWGDSTEEPPLPVAGRFIDIMLSAGASDAAVLPFAAAAPFLLPFAQNRLPGNPQTVITAVFPYHIGRKPKNLARYAMLPDYHTWVMAMLQNAADRLSALFPRHTFIPFCDHSPIPEVSAAAASGLGAVGRHGLLVHPVYGSWVHIGEIVTDMSVASNEQTVSFCQNCGRCEKACPADAIGGEKARCISALTQKKGVLTDHEAELIRQCGTVWGCDLCQEACPMNEGSQLSPYVFSDVLDEITHEINMKNRAFAWRGKEVLLRNLDLL